MSRGTTRYGAWLKEHCKFSTDPSFGLLHISLMHTNSGRNTPTANRIHPQRCPVIIRRFTAPYNAASGYIALGHPTVCIELRVTARETIALAFPTMYPTKTLAPLQLRPLPPDMSGLIRERDAACSASHRRKPNANAVFADTTLAGFRLARAWYTNPRPKKM